MLSSQCGTAANTLLWEPPVHKGSPCQPARPPVCLAPARSSPHNHVR